MNKIIFVSVFISVFFSQNLLWSAGNAFFESGKSDSGNLQTSGDEKLNVQHRHLTLSTDALISAENKINSNQNQDEDQSFLSTAVASYNEAFIEASVYSADTKVQAEKSLAGYIQDLLTTLFNRRIEYEKLNSEKGDRVEMDNIVEQAQREYFSAFSMYLEMRNQMGPAFDEQLKKIIPITEFKIQCDKSNEKCEMVSFVDFMKRFPDIIQVLGVSAEQMNASTQPQNMNVNPENILPNMNESRPEILSCDVSKLERLTLKLKIKNSDLKINSWSGSVKNIGGCNRVSIHWIHNESGLKILNVEVQYPGVDNAQGLSSKDYSLLLSKLK